ncbi:MAG: hypothetical protein JWQ27_1248 [Ferruginibacter sp.]|nr:hypothetical protein [Ferruginibacter sp.]
MKKLIVFALILISTLSYAQTAGRLEGTATCTCQPGYTICQASSLFMSCCTCCQPGSSCGSWTAFGLCGCICESTSSKRGSEVKFYSEKYDAFMDYLDRNNVASADFRVYANTAKAGKLLKTGDAGTANYVVLSAEDNKAFSDQYIADMKRLIADPRVSQLIDTYLKENK